MDMALSIACRAGLKRKWKHVIWALVVNTLVLDPPSQTCQQGVVESVHLSKLLCPRKMNQMSERKKHHLSKKETLDNMSKVHKIQEIMSETAVERFDV